MAEPPPVLPPIPEHIRRLPFAVRLGLWLAYGTALGLPVDAVFGLASVTMAAAKRQLRSQRLRMTVAERLRAASHAAVIPMACRDLLEWLVSPASLIRWLKRYQERQANGGASPPAQTSGRPWIGAEKVEAIVFLSEEHLRQAVVAYIRHHNEERPHQGIGNVPVGPWSIGTGPIVCDESLDGLLKSFRRAA